MIEMLKKGLALLVLLGVVCLTGFVMISKAANNNSNETKTVPSGTVINPNSNGTVTPTSTTVVVPTTVPGGYYPPAGGSTLGDLIVLNGLFNSGNGLVTTTSTTEAKDKDCDDNLITTTSTIGGQRDNLLSLAGLIAVDRAVGGAGTGSVYGGYYPTAGGSTLGDLIVLNGLFNGDGVLGTSSSNLSGLAGLIAVDRAVGF